MERICFALPLFFMGQGIQSFGLFCLSENLFIVHLFTQTQPHSHPYNKTAGYVLLLRGAQLAKSSLLAINVDYITAHRIITRISTIST